MMDVKERIANIVDDSGNCTIADPCHDSIKEFLKDQKLFRYAGEVRIKEVE